MDLNRYTKTIEKLARALKSGKINQNQISDFLEGEVAPIYKNSKTTDLTDEEIDKQLAENDQRVKESEILQQYQELNKAFVGIIETINEVQESKSPFSIKFNAHKIVKAYDVLRYYKDDDNYDYIRLLTIDRIAKYRKELLLNNEYIKVLDKKYIPE